MRVNRSGGCHVAMRLSRRPVVAVIAAALPVATAFSSSGAATGTGPVASTSSPGAVPTAVAPLTPAAPPSSWREPRPATVYPWLNPLGAPGTLPTVVRGFSPGPYPWSSGHRGVDLLGTRGQAVRAPAVGVVAYVGTVAGVGVLSISHPDGTRSTYQPVRSALSRGDAVAAGLVVATLRLRGSHCAPAACLHWGAIHHDRYVDPMLRLAGAPRLLPLSGRSFG